MCNNLSVSRNFLLQTLPIDLIKDEIYVALIELALSPTSEKKKVPLNKASVISIYLSVSKMDQFSLTAPNTVFASCL